MESRYLCIHTFWRPWKTELNSQLSQCTRVASGILWWCMLLQKDLERTWEIKYFLIVKNYSKYNNKKKKKKEKSDSKELHKYLTIWSNGMINCLIEFSLINSKWYIQTRGKKKQKQKPNYAYPMMDANLAINSQERDLEIIADLAMILLWKC